MFPLDVSQPPQSRTDLQAALARSLRSVCILPPQRETVVLTGEDFPHLTSLTVDLSGASLSPQADLSRPTPTGQVVPGPSLERLQLLAHPLCYQQACLDVMLDAQGVRLDYDRDPRGRVLLVVADAARGTFDLEVSPADLQALLLSAGRAIAEEHGIKLKEAQIILSPAGPHSVVAEVRVVASKLVFTGTLRLRGRVDLNDQLEATVSGLACDGEGKVGTIVCALLRPHLERANGQSFPLATFSLGAVHLRDVQIAVTPEIHISAVFGSDSE